MSRYTLTILAVCLIALTTASDKNNKILVLTDGSNIQVSHSQFFDNLKKAGFLIDFKPADDPSLQLIEYGVNVYDHLAIFAPNADEFGGDLSTPKIAEYVDNGGNVLIALDSRVTDTIRATAAEFGVETDTEGTFVIDHFNYAAELDAGDRTVLNLATEKFYSNAKPFTPKKAAVSDGLLYQGIGMVVNGKNNLVSPVLTAPSTSYSWTPDKPVTSMPMMIGKETTLISALEARNNARVLICGSLKFFSDEFSSSNELHARQIGLWAFQRAGVLRLSNVQHYLSDTKQTLETYTIFDMMTFRVDVHEKNEAGEWVVAENDDIQVEWTRIDPFVLQYLKKDSDGSQMLEFKIPHTYGVFKFIIDYKRVGYTYLQLEEVVPVRPLQHTQYERFIVSAYPYYAGAGSMLVGLFLFSFVFLYHK